jgi:hypothetical protein
MPNTYDLITTQTLGSTSALITVSLPTSSYTDIQLRVSLRSNRAGQAADGGLIYFNGDSNTANYNRLTFYDEGGATGSEISKGTSTSQQLGTIPAATTNSALFNNGVIDLVNYLSSSRKAFMTYTAFQITGGATRYIWSNFMDYTSTSTITSATFGLFNSSFVAGSSVSVYGIKKA